MVTISRQKVNWLTDSSITNAKQGVQSFSQTAYAQVVAIVPS